MRRSFGQKREDGPLSGRQFIARARHRTAR
jgi:hypothetical protein